MRSILILLSLFGVTNTQAQAQVDARSILARTKQHLSCKKHDKKQPTPDFGSATIRAYPFSFAEVKLAPQKRTLAAVFNEYDIAAFTLTTTTQRTKRRLNSQSKPFPDGAGRFAVANNNRAFGTPQVMVFIKNNRVLIIPRMLILHPLISYLPVSSGDMIASFYLSDADNLKEPGTTYTVIENKRTETRTRDLFVNFMPSFTGTGQYISKDPPQLVGSLVNRKLKESVQEEFNKNSRLVAGFFTLADEAVSKRFAAENSDINSNMQNIPIENKFPVFVLRRQSGPFLYYYVQPLKKSGQFARTGKLMTKFNRDKPSKAISNACKKLWDDAISRILTNQSAGEIADGDQFIVTELEPFLLSSGFLLR